MDFQMIYRIRIFAVWSSLTRYANPKILFRLPSSWIWISMCTYLIVYSVHVHKCIWTEVHLHVRLAVEWEFCWNAVVCSMGGKQNHPTHGSESLLTHLCALQNRSIQKQGPHWWSCLSLSFGCRWVSLLVWPLVGNKNPK